MGVGQEGRRIKALVELSNVLTDESGCYKTAVCQNGYGKSTQKAPEFSGIGSRKYPNPEALGPVLNALNSRSSPDFC